MSMLVLLLHPDAQEPVEVTQAEAPKTYPFSAYEEAVLNVPLTYDLVVFDLFGCDLKALLHEQSAYEVAPWLEEGVDRLGTKQTADRFEATKGNVGAALAILLRWAKECPVAIFFVQS